MTDAPDDAEPGQVVWLDSDLRRVLAPNPSPMTFRGTNTFLLGRGDVALIDPGPAIPAHLGAILAALEPGERISQIFCTHSHLDHSGLARPLAEAVGAPIRAYGSSDAGRSPAMAAWAAAGGLGGGEGIDTAFTPDHLLADGETVRGDGWRLTAVWTPGHIGNHLCFDAGGRVFSGDHVMGWSTSFVSPPDGDMGAYMTSLDRLAARGATVLHPAHGGPVHDPAARIGELTAHRRAREAAIFAALGDRPQDIATLTATVYRDTPVALHPAAARNILAHLLDLQDRMLVASDTPPGPAARFRRL
ncbi:MAG: MBL fold metallo-hydrolase [Rhodobacteraceae bacterium]|nr:MBL fold metallo-hydrolase [Paracoccaceae bacterium]